MYEQIFNFNSRPFTSAPFVKHYSANESMHQALVQARQSIDRGAGPVVVVGDTGTGKSLLLAMLEAQYQNQFSVCNLDCVRLDKRESLLQAILFGLGQPYQGMSEGDLRFALIEYLKPTDRCPNGVLLLIDDAQRLDAGLMDEIKLITNFSRDGQPRVRLVLAGSQKLEDNLADPRLQSLNQRISARCFLNNLTRDETANYVREHVSRVGGQPEQLFDNEALKAIHECSGGCPRLINQICEHALMIAATQSPHLVTESKVREAWNDVQGIPGDWSAPAPAPPAPTELEGDDSWTVIEFGQLDDDGDESTQAYDFGGQVEQSQPIENSFTADPQVGELVSLKPLETTTETPQQTEAPFTAFEPEQETAAGDQLGLTAAESAAIMHETQSPLMQVDSQGDIDDEPDQEEPAQEEPDETPKVKLREKVETVDPFAESFDEEEQLSDRFAPMVVEQNVSSLGVTSADLQSIRPLDEAEPSQNSEPLGETETDDAANLVADLTEATEPVDVVEDSNPSPGKFTGSIPTIFKSAEPEPQAETQPDAAPALKASIVKVSKVQQPVEPVAQPQEAVAPVAETDEEKPIERPADAEMLSEAPADVEAEANAILERLRKSQEVSHETTQHDAVAEKPGLELANKDKGLEETQKILAEILEQKSVLAASQAGIDLEPKEGQKTVEPLKMEYPVIASDESQISKDDREMILVSRTEQQTESSRPKAPETPAFPQTPVSTGQAERMDYQKLFDQLRDISND